MRFYECYIRPQSGEIIDAAIPLPPESGALITGRVFDSPEHPAAGALILLLAQEDGTLLNATTSDMEGRFYLGPVAPDQLYTLRVQYSGTRTRILELMV